MIEEIGGLAAQRLPVAAQSGDNGFRAFLTEFLGAALDAGIEQFLGIGGTGRRRAARGDQRRQARQDIIDLGGLRHLRLTTAIPDAASPTPNYDATRPSRAVSPWAALGCASGHLGRPLGGPRCRPVSPPAGCG